MSDNAFFTVEDGNEDNKTPKKGRESTKSHEETQLQKLRGIVS
jgi:hypothetical protein